jgi:hypothetical protein
LNSRHASAIDVNGDSEKWQSEQTGETDKIQEALYHETGGARGIEIAVDLQAAYVI